MFTIRFWKDAAERALKTAAEAVLLAITASNTGPINLFELDWLIGLGAAGGGAVLSFLSSIISAPFGNEGTASLVN